MLIFFFSLYVILFATDVNFTFCNRDCCVCTSPELFSFTKCSMVAVLLCFGLAALKSTFSALKALGLVWQFCLEPENSTGWVGEETGLVGDTTNLLYLHFCSLHDHVWIGRRQFSVINLDFFFFFFHVASQCVVPKSQWQHPVWWELEQQERN